MPLTFRNPQGQEEEYKLKGRQPMPRLLTSPSGRKVRVPEQDQIGNVSLRPAGYENINPTQPGMDLSSLRPASQQLSELAQNVDAAQTPLPPGTTQADLVPPGQMPAARTGYDIQLEQATMQRKQATNARFKANGQPVPYPEAEVQQVQGQPGQMQPMVNMPVHGLTEGMQVPSDKFGQRLFYADYAAQLQMNKSRNLAGDKDMAGRQKAIGDLDSFGDFSYLELDPSTTAQLRQLADAGKKSIAPGAAYARIVDLIHAKRADIHAAEQERKRQTETQRREELVATTAQAKAKTDAEEKRVSELDKSNVELGKSEVDIAETTIKQAEAAFEKLKKLSPSLDATKEQQDAHDKVIEGALARKLAGQELIGTSLQGRINRLRDAAPAARSGIPGAGDVTAPPAAPAAQPAPAAAVQAPATPIVPPTIPANEAATRPSVQNPDGSTSTVRTISIGTDQGEILIPTVINGKVVSNAEAMAEYRRTGRHFGIYRTPEEANAAGEALHLSEAARIQPAPARGPTAAEIDANARRQHAENVKRATAEARPAGKKAEPAAATAPSTAPEAKPRVYATEEWDKLSEDERAASNALWHKSWSKQYGVPPEAFVGTAGEDPGKKAMDWKVKEWAKPYDDRRAKVQVKIDKAAGDSTKMGAAEKEIETINTEQVRTVWSRIEAGTPLQDLDAEIRALPQQAAIMLRDHLKQLGRIK